MVSRDQFGQCHGKTLSMGQVERVGSFSFPALIDELFTLL